MHHVDVTTAPNEAYTLHKMSRVTDEETYEIVKLQVIKKVQNPQHSMIKPHTKKECACILPTWVKIRSNVEQYGNNKDREYIAGLLSNIELHFSKITVSHIIIVNKLT